MLNLTRQPGEAIVITNSENGDTIVIEFADYNTVQGARLRIKAESKYHIDRQENRGHPARRRRPR